MMVLLTALVTSGFGVVGIPRVQVPDSLAVAVALALAHARTVIPEGAILVSSDTVPQTEVRRKAESRLPKRSLLEKAAEAAGFAFGSDDEARHCGPRGWCDGRGDFRGLVHVAEYRLRDPNSIIITLRMLRLTSADDPSPTLFEQVDEVHVTRRDSASDWRIERVNLISIT